MNASFKSVCQNCQIESNHKLVDCAVCGFSKDSVDIDSSFQEIEPMPIELKVVVKPIALLLLLIGMPLALVSGISLSRTKKVRGLGALALFVVMLGKFGVGVQLIAAAMAVALTLV